VGQRLAAMSALGMALFTATHAIPTPQALACARTLVVSFLAYGLLAVAACMRCDDHAENSCIAVHAGRTPPLLTLEAHAVQTIGIGFALLTLAVFSGVFFSEELFGTPLQFSHKIVFAILSWLVFGGLLLGRHFRGWRGRTALVWTITGFTLLLLAYLGTQFVLEVVLRR
jgi:ABC-type uncharacterized transport system permease subunit